MGCSPQCSETYAPERDLSPKRKPHQNADCSSVVWAVSAHPCRIVRYGRHYRSRTVVWAVAAHPLLGSSDTDEVTLEEPRHRSHETLLASMA